MCLFLSGGRRGLKCCCSEIEVSSVFGVVLSRWGEEGGEDSHCFGWVGWVGWVCFPSLKGLYHGGGVVGVGVGGCSWFLLSLYL